MILKLLPEVQEKILEYCLIRDLKNLAQTCHELHILLKPILYCCITIPYSKWERQNFHLDGERQLWRQHTKKLCISPEVKRLFLSSGNLPFIPDILFKQLSKLEHLEKLDMRGNRIDSSNLRQIASGLKGLQILDISQTGVGSDGFQYINELSLLEELYAEACGIGPTTLQDIASLSKLRVLDLSECPDVNNDWFIQLTVMTSLEELYLRMCLWLNDKGLSHIASISSLLSLDLTFCEQISNEAFAHLVKLNNLESLCLDTCNQITEVGFSNIRRLSSLKRLDVTNCQGFTFEIQNSLASALPTLHISGDRWR